jgi:type I restriction enzyme M protein
MLIKDEPVNNIVPGDTLGDGKTSDGHAGKTFHYMMANPPFGVEWKRQQAQVQKEHEQFGFDGRFGPGLPRIDNGSLLFLLTMIAKRKPAPQDGGEGSKIAIVFNGTPLFMGDAGSGERAISDAGLSRTTGSTRLSRCPINSSITPEFSPTYGSCRTANQSIGRDACS